MVVRVARASVLLVALTAFNGCHNRSRPPSPPSPINARVNAVEASVTGSAASGMMAVPAPPQVLQPSQQLIRRGNMGVQVGSLGESTTRLERTAGALGAQITRSTVEERERAELFIRVPPPQLDALMDSVAALGEVESRFVGVEDVTDRVIDAEARLGSLRASRDRLRQLLERASSVQDVISVERELARIQAEIESLEARLAALRGQVAMSELSVTLRQRPVLGPLGVVAAGLGTAVRKLFIWR